MSLKLLNGVVPLCQGAAETLQFDAIVVAVGNYAQPNLPSSVAGMRTFPALQMHCHNFRSPQQFAEQTVLVVGASFSGKCQHGNPQQAERTQQAERKTLSANGP